MIESCSTRCSGKCAVCLSTVKCGCVKSIPLLGQCSLARVQSASTPLQNISGCTMTPLLGDSTPHMFLGHDIIASMQSSTGSCRIPSWTMPSASLMSYFVDTLPLHVRRLHFICRRVRAELTANNVPASAVARAVAFLPLCFC